MKRDHLITAGMLGLLAMDGAVSVERRPRYRRESAPGKGGKRTTKVINGTRYQQRAKRSR